MIRLSDIPSRHWCWLIALAVMLVFVVCAVSGGTWNQYTAKEMRLIEKDLELFIVQVRDAIQHRGNKPWNHEWSMHWWRAYDYEFTNNDGTPESRRAIAAYVAASVFMETRK